MKTAQRRKILLNAEYWVLKRDNEQHLAEHNEHLSSNKVSNNLYKKNLSLVLYCSYEVNAGTFLVDKKP